MAPVARSVVPEIKKYIIANSAYISAEGIGRMDSVLIHCFQDTHYSFVENVLYIRFLQSSSTELHLKPSRKMGVEVPDYFLLAILEALQICGVESLAHFFFLFGR